MEDDPPYQITIGSDCGTAAIPESTLQKAIEVALRLHNVPEARLSFALVNDATIERLNHAHLGHTGPTDVLTFDLRDAESDELEGEIVLSVSMAAREADARGHEVDAEIALYAVHGVLHLLGYDDHEDEGALKMHEMEDRILSEAGFGPVFHPVKR